MTKSLLTVLLATASLTAHAGLLDGLTKKPAAPAVPATPVAPAAPAAPAADTAKAAAAEVTAESKKIAAGLTESFKAELAAASQKAIDSTKALLGDAKTSAPLKEQLAKLSDSLTGSKDGASAETLAKIVALKPTPEQMGLVKELQSNLGVLVLGRNFDQNDPASGGAVKSAIEAIKGKDTTAILSSLQQLAAQTNFTDAQKQMATNLLSSWSPGVAAAVDKAKEGAKALKGFGF